MKRIIRLLAIFMIVAMMITMVVSCKKKQGPQGEQGIQGEQGLPGKDGVTPTIEISDDGYWIINGIKSFYKAIGTDGKDGIDGEDGKDGINGTNGVNGVTPTITISEDGYWIINGEKTEHKAIGIDGTNGSNGTNGDDGTPGKDGATIKKVEFDAQGRIVITLTNGTVLEPIELPKKEEHIHAFGAWLYYNDESVHCDKALFYRICSDCDGLEWKSGTEDDHAYVTVTTAPTCTKGGYDTKTCSNCGKAVVCNETAIIDHQYPDEYVSNNSFHWKKCNACDSTVDNAEHDLGDNGICLVCDAVIGDTEGIIYDISADGTYAEVIDYTGKATRIRIAATYNGLPVRTICDNAFRDKNAITSVIIPDSVTSIGNYAFYFSYMGANSSLASVTIGKGVTDIGEYAFGGCSRIRDITIPDSVTTIGDYAFYYCCSIDSITIPDSVKSIGRCAFYECHDLADVTIGEGLASIEALAFYNCNSNLYTKHADATYIGDGDNPYQILYEVTNKNLSSYTIHEKTKMIVNEAFIGCGRLTSITIPDSVTSIGPVSFATCSSLTSITIPNSVTNIGLGAFHSCTSLTSIKFEGTVEQWSAINFGDIWKGGVPATEVICSDGTVPLT